MGRADWPLVVNGYLKRQTCNIVCQAVEFARFDTLAEFIHRLLEIMIHWSFASLSKDGIQTIV